MNLMRKNNLIKLIFKKYVKDVKYVKYVKYLK